MCVSSPTQAIQYAWELSTQVFGLPPERVWVSVYEEDDEAYNLWRDVIGVPPERIKRMGAADNFWASGSTGILGHTHTHTHAYMGVGCLFLQH